MLPVKQCQQRVHNLLKIAMVQGRDQNDYLQGRESRLPSQSHGSGDQNLIHAASQQFPKAKCFTCYALKANNLLQQSCVVWSTAASGFRVQGLGFRIQGALRNRVLGAGAQFVLVAWVQEFQIS